MENSVMTRAGKAAAMYFPDASEEFIYGNRLALMGQHEADTRCMLCTVSNSHECPTYGHIPYLRIDPRGGYCVEYVDTEVCGKYRRKQEVGNEM